MGNVNVVLHDNAGNVRRYDAPFAVDATLLRRGATEDSAAVGRVSAGGILFDGMYRRGLSDRVTASAHLAGSGNAIAAAAGANVMLMPVTVHVGAAALNGRVAGFDASLAVPMRGGSVSLGLTQRSEALANLNSDPTFGVETRRLSLEFSRRLSPSIDAYASVNGSTYSTSGPSQTANAGVRIRTGAAAFASVYLENTRTAGFAPHTAIAMSFTTSLSHNRSFSANTAAGSAGVEIQQAPPGQTGFSYDVRSGLDTQNAMAMEQTSRARSRHRPIGPAAS